MTADVDSNGPSGRDLSDDKKNFWSDYNPLTHFREDFLASLVVFLVALPLCLGIAEATGVPVALGLITGIVGGILVGLIAGAPLQVSGPAAGLIVILVELLAHQRSAFLESNPDASKIDIQTYALASLGAAVFVGGVLQIVAGLFKLGQWFRAVSPAVVQGMLAGIGVLIFASQFHVMVDDDPKGNAVQNIITIPMAIYKGINPEIGDKHHHLAAFIGLLTIGTIVGWQYLAPKKLRLIPGPLLAVVGATLVALFLNFGVEKIVVPANLFSEIQLPDQQYLYLLFEPTVLLNGVVIAMIASAETLLCATAVDQMHDGEPAEYDRELGAQGVGNAMCGLMGTLPMTGVIVRSSANVQAGAKTRWSAIFHGFWLLLFVAFLGQYLKYIPTACLGGILVYTGYKLMNIEKIKELAKTGRGEVIIYFATVIAIVVEDLLTGVVLGIVMSALKLLYTFSNLEVNLEKKPDEQTAVLHLYGAATFIRLPMLASALEEVPKGYELRVDVSHMGYIDHACLDLLNSWGKRHAQTGGKLIIDWDHLKEMYNQSEDTERAVGKRKKADGSPASDGVPLVGAGAGATTSNQESAS